MGEIIHLTEFQPDDENINNDYNTDSGQLLSRSVNDGSKDEIAVSKQDGGDDGMGGNDDYVKHSELNNELINLRTEIGLQFENQYLKIEKLINDKSVENRKEQKSDKHWTIGIVLSGTGILVAISSLILGIVLH